MSTTVVRHETHRESTNRYRCRETSPTGVDEPWRPILWARLGRRSRHQRAVGTRSHAAGGGVRQCSSVRLSGDRSYITRVPLRVGEREEEEGRSTTPGERGVARSARLVRRPRSRRRAPRRSGSSERRLGRRYSSSPPPVLVRRTSRRSVACRSSVAERRGGRWAAERRAAARALVQPELVALELRLA